MVLAPSSPQLTAVDPFANPANPSDPLKPARQYWYSADEAGLTILRLADNSVVYQVAWPQTIDIALPDGELENVSAPASGWKPVGITVSYPTEEQLASNSETPATYVYVVMAHSGFEWRSNPNPPDLRSPNLRDEIVPSTNPDTESGMLVQVDVTDPTYPVATYPNGPFITGGIVGHNPGQPAFEPGLGTVYVPNMPTTSLPTTPQVPNDLTSFVSVMAVAPSEAAAGEAGGGEGSILVLCGPEHPEVGILVGVPEAWACIPEGGEGPFVWSFDNLPSWLTAHPDKLTGQLDGILYGTPLEPGTFTFQASVVDYATNPPATGTATVTLLVLDVVESEGGEGEWEVGVPAALAIEGTGTCELAPTLSPGSLVPEWIEAVEIPGRPNPLLPTEQTKGCVVMGTAPVSGEYYEFSMPNFHFAYPFDREEIIFSGKVGGPYNFVPLPAGVGLSGLAWHQIEKIHDASTEADILNAEFFGVEPFSGQVYRILQPVLALESEGAIPPPPETQGEADEVSTYAELLPALKAARPDIAGILEANPDLRVKFGNVVVEASHDPNVFVSAPEIRDPTGADSTVIAIGGPHDSALPLGALIKVSGVRDADDVGEVTPSAITPIALPGVQALWPALDSDLAPAIPEAEPGQVDHGVLWVTGATSGNVVLVDTALGKYAQMLPVPGAASLGNTAVNPGSRLAYVGGLSLQSVFICAPGTPPDMAPEIWSSSATTFIVGAPGSFTVIATGAPTLPTLSATGGLPGGVTFTDNGDGTATLAGTPAAVGSHAFTITAANGVAPDASQEFTLTVVPGTPPAITSANTATFTVGSPGSFTVTATGSPTPTVSMAGVLPDGVAFLDNHDGTASLAGTPSTVGNYSFTITAANGAPRPDATQEFTLVVVGVPPAITSLGIATFTVGSPASFTVTATGRPVPALTWEGELPAGVTFLDNGDGTATLGGAAGAAGSYSLAITASNGWLPNATQDFVLIVNPVPTAPAITSANATTFIAGSPGSFTVTATGVPTPTLSAVGALPSGVTFTDNGNGTATLAGTPGAVRAFPLTITAWNGVPPNATQVFTLTVSSATEKQAPQAISVAPLSGNNAGMGDTFVARFSDLNGAGDIRRLQVIFNASATPAGACDVVYYPGPNTLALYQESAWSAAVTVGTPGATLVNNQCTLDVGASSVVRNGAELTVNLPLAFKGTWPGVKNVYLYADDLGGLSTGGWQVRGTYTVANQAPQAISVAPLSGNATGNGDTFVAHFSDGNGADDIQRAQVIFNSSQSPLGACDVAYYPGPNTLALYQETAWSAAVAVGTAGATLENNQCTVDVAASSVARDGNDLTVNLALAFKGTWQGLKNIYLFANDRAGLGTGGWQLRGTYRVGIANQAPQAVSVAPLSGNGTGSGDTFVAHFSDANGTDDIRRTQVIFNTGMTPVGSCDVIYYPGSNTLALYQETAWSASLTVGTPGATLENNQCLLDVAASTVVRAGNDLTVNLALSFKTAWTGTKNIYLFADDRSGLGTGGWQLRGSYTVAHQGQLIGRAQ